MKNFYELPDTKDIDVDINIMSKSDNGIPVVKVDLNDNILYYNKLSGNLLLSSKISICDPININISLSRKIHKNTEIIIKSIKIDGIELIPKYNFYTQYINDYDNNIKTNHLGFNGIWTFYTNKPFYQWLHQASNQGWLLTP
jgi:hypothetical protein